MESSCLASETFKTVEKSLQDMLLTRLFTQVTAKNILSIRRQNNETEIMTMIEFFMN